MAETPYASPLAYRVGASLPGAHLQVHDPITDEPSHVLDLGARSCAGEGGWVVGRLVREDLELVADVQELCLLAYGTAPRDLARVTDQLREGRDGIGRAAFRVLQRASAGDVPDLDVPFVAAAALNPFAHGEALRKLCHVAERHSWSRWAELAPEPGRGRLLALADASALAA